MAYDLGHHLIMVAYDGDDPNGSPTGELTDVFDKSFQIRHNAPGAGEFKLNRHSSQRTITQPDSYIRCYLDDPDSDPVFAFWVTESQDVVLGPGEDGVEVMQKKGEGAMSYMADAIVWWTSVTNADAAVPHPDDDMWHWENVHPAGILVRMIEEAVERGCYPDLSYDFDRDNDSNGDPWTTTITDFKVQVGTDLLTLMGYLQTMGLVFVMDPDLTLHAYEAPYGADLSGSVVFTKGIDISETADRHQVSAPARSTVLVKGARSDNDETAWVEANSVAGLAEVKRRKEGFFDAQDTTHFDTLQAIGLEEIYQKLRLKAGPTNLVVLPLDTQVPLTDYNVGDIVTVDVTGIWNSDPKQITYIGFTQRSNDEYDVAVGFEDNPALRSLASSPVSAATKTPVCCPDEPFVPEFNDLCAVSTPSGTYPPLNSATTDAAAVVYYCAPGHPYPDTKTPGHTGGWAFATYGSGGSPDDSAAAFWSSGAQQLRLIVSGDGVITFTMNSTGTQIFDWVLLHGPEAGATTDEFGSGTSGTPVSVNVSSHGGVNCEHRIVVSLGAQPITASGFGFDGADWVVATAGVSNTPGNGQAVTESTTGDAVTTTFFTNYPYYPQSLHVWVNGLLWPVTETDPTTGEFEFDTPPPAGAVIVIHYQATGEAGTGAGNDPTPDASHPPPASLALDDLTDVDTTGKSVDDVLVWDGANWVAGTPTTASALDDLTDVVITAPAVGDRLRFDGSNWVNTTLIWKPVLALDPGTGLYVNVHSGGDPVMAEG